MGDTQKIKGNFVRNKDSKFKKSMKTYKENTIKEESK